MGRGTRWLRWLLGRRNTHPEPAPRPEKEKEKKRWSFGRSSRYRERKGSFREESSSLHVNSEEQRKQAVAVAAAAAEAAVTAVAEVMRLTRRGRTVNVSFGGGASLRREVLAAVKIQAAFRGYLGRKALRALRGLVRLQALVRGHIDRNRVAKMLRRVEALVQAQARAGTGQTREFWPENRLAVAKGLLAQRGPATPEKYETNVVRISSARHYSPPSLKRSNPKSGKKSIDMDPSPGSRAWLDQWVDRRSLPEFQSKESTRIQPSTANTSSAGIQSNGSAFGSTNTSPQVCSFTPSKSGDRSGSVFSGWSDYPSYMADTASSKAKARSQSAPRQRPDLCKSSSKKRLPGDGHGGRMVTGGRAEKAYAQRVVPSSLHGKLTGMSRAGSGRSDRRGVPVD